MASKLNTADSPSRSSSLKNFEIARYAASLVHVEYEREPHATDLSDKREEAYEPKKNRSGIPPPAKPRGACQSELSTALPSNTMPNIVMRLSITIRWRCMLRPLCGKPNGKITVYDKTQGAQNSQAYIASVFGFSKDDVRVVSSYIGGAFGSGLRPQYQLFLAVMAARELKRSVRVSADASTDVHLRLSSRYDSKSRARRFSADGTLESVMHDALGNTSRFEDYQENDVNWSGLLYKCDNSKFTYKIAQLDLYTPLDMRAPGGATGRLRARMRDGRARLRSRRRPARTCV
ncbi:MAG: molybdopterin cofactor-binding domain-containing protein [Pyrinomonadaceae bacterium]